MKKRPVSEAERGLRATGCAWVKDKSTSACTFGTAFAANKGLKTTDLNAASLGDYAWLKVIGDT